MVTIRFYGSAASVDASAVPDAVLRCMEVVERRWRPTSTGGQWFDERFALYRRTSRNGEILFPAGLAHRLVRELNRRGISVRPRAFDSSALESIPLDPDFVSRANAVDRNLTDSLHRHRHGLIICRNYAGRIRTLATICGGYAQARIFISVATLDQLHDVARELDKQLTEPVCSVQGGEWETGRRITIGTFRSLESLRDPRDWNVVIFPFAEMAIARKPIAARMRLLHSRVIGLVDAQARFSESEQRRLAALAGPVIATTAGIAVPPRVNVRFVDVPGHIGVQGRDPLALKRKLYWRNDSRNRRVAEVARAAWDGSLRDEQYRTSHQHTQPIIVLTESAEHASQFRRFLPGWSLLTAEPQRSAKLERVVSTGCLPDRSIVTMSFAQRLGYLDFGTSIVASGGEWLTESHTLQPRRCSGPITITDFEDLFEPIAEAASQVRRANYRTCGFHVEDNNEVPTDQMNTAR